MIGTLDMPPPQLQILLISDFHESYDRIDQLSEYIRSHYISYDAILYLGDFLTLPPNPSEAEERQAIQEVEEILKLLSTKLNDGHKVIYVPGNHDPKTLFTRPRSITEHGVLLHNRLVKLCPKRANDFSSVPLILHGFGGSSPGIQNGSVVWEGFPYVTDNDLEREFNSQKSTIECSAAAAVVMNATANDNDDNSEIVSVGRDLKVLPVTEKDVRSDSSVVLVTHQGPEHSSTGVYTKTNDPIYSGSGALFNAVWKSHNIVAQVHGHTHDAWGVCRIRERMIVNPGSMKYGRCALITLRFNGLKWDVVETGLISFD